MEEILNSIVIHGKTAEECINRELLERYTSRITAPFVKKLRWAKIKHLYILGREPNLSPCFLQKEISSVFSFKISFRKRKGSK